MASLRSGCRPIRPKFDPLRELKRTASALSQCLLIRLGHMDGRPSTCIAIDAGLLDTAAIVVEKSYGCFTAAVMQFRASGNPRFVHCRAYCMSIGAQLCPLIGVDPLSDGFGR